MSPPVPVDDWPAIDSWWGNFRQDQPLVLAPPSISEMPDVVRVGDWNTVDPLWDAFEEDRELRFAEQHVWELSDDVEQDGWETVDDFWASYGGQQQDHLLELQELMADLREEWTAGASPFDEDPLTTNWRSESQYEGPLRATINEEDWSQWLAHLLRTSSGPFAHELLGTPDRPPANVRREVVFFGSDSQRRVDVLVEYEALGVSIEVKQGDEHYEKTPETAGLVERNDRRDWSHVLLLQKDKLPRLQQAFGDEFDRSKEGPPTIRSDHFPDVDVRYWRDVSRVLRRMLLDGREPSSHWEASAYLFITLVEQRVLGLHSFSFVNPATAASSDTAPATDIHRLVVAEPDVQIDYLRALLEEDDNNE
jgi:hypothetical protein